MLKNLKTKIKKRTGKGPTRKKFKFKSKVIVWREGYNEGNDKCYNVFIC